jgi:beta propeller repeat protein
MMFSITHKIERYLLVLAITAGTGSICGTERAHALSFTTTQLTNTAWDNSMPVVSGNLVAWEDYRNAGAASGYGLPGISVYNTSTATANYVLTNSQALVTAFPTPFLAHHKKSDIAIAGDTITWSRGVPYSPSRLPSNLMDIYQYNLTTKVMSPLATSPGSESRPDMFGNTVVWQDPLPCKATGCQWNIFSYNLSSHATTTLVSDSSGKYPATGGATTAWQGLVGGAWKVQTYDYGTGTIKTIAPGVEPEVSGSHVVYENYHPGAGNYDIFDYNMATGITTRVTNDTVDQQRAMISGNYITWGDDRTGTEQVYLYNLLDGTTYQVTNAPGGAWYPEIDGNHIVYMAKLGTNWQIFETDIINQSLTLNRLESLQPVATPEPGTWLLLATGLLGFRIFHYRHERAKIASPNPARSA